MNGNKFIINKNGGHLNKQSTLNFNRIVILKALNVYIQFIWKLYLYILYRSGEITKKKID